MFLKYDPEKEDLKAKVDELQADLEKLRTLRDGSERLVRNAVN